MMCLKLNLHSTKVRLKQVAELDTRVKALDLHSTKVRLKHN